MIVFIICLIVVLFLLQTLKDSFTKVNKKIAIVSMMYNPKNIETWIDKHRKLGISHFYIRLEDTPSIIEYLQSQPDVTLELGKSSDSNQFFSLMERQIKMVDTFLPQIKENYIIHIDSDEILEGSLDEILYLPDEISTFWMQNHEAVYKSIPTKNDNCFQAIEYRNCEDTKAGCASYINGKGGSRVYERTGLDGGPHRFRSNGGKEVKLNNLKVLHYESCDFDQYIDKYSKYQKNSDLTKIPFQYYRDSITSHPDNLKEIYTKYRVKK